MMALLDPKDSGARVEELTHLQTKINRNRAEERRRNNEDIYVTTNSASLETGTVPSAARKRISKACDHCNSARRKCDGHHPCGYCLRTRSRCDYKRQPKKRGKIPASSLKKPKVGQTVLDLLQAAEISSKGSTEVDISENVSHVSPPAEEGRQDHEVDITSNGGVNPSEMTGGFTFSPLVDDYQMFDFDPDWGMDMDMEHIIQDTSALGANDNGNLQGNIANNTSDLGCQITSPKTREVRRITYGIHSFSSVDEEGQPHPSGPLNPISQSDFKISRTGSLPKIQNDITTSERRSNRTLHRTTVIPQEMRDNSTLRYPVLADTMHLLRPFIPDALSFDLLEAYFKISPVTNACLQPCVPPSVYRRYSFLHSDEPRQSSHVLLISMLWLSAQTADIPLLNLNIARRKYVRRKLLELTTRLLKPLNEVSLDGNMSRKPRNTSSAESPEETGRQPSEKLHSKVNDGLDEVMAYVHLAMVTSASEFKGASLRWWNIAFSLAREAKLYQEVPESLPNFQGDEDGTGLSPESQRLRSQIFRQRHSFEEPNIFASLISEEEREERRRVWWFLYAIDRHLSLSYNKPLALLDSECQNLRRPCDDAIWQCNRIFEPSQVSEPGKGPYFECNGPSFFGFFLPITALLGEIVYFVQAQNHPRFGISQSTLLDWKQWEKGISERLDSYEQSLECLLQPSVLNDDQLHCIIDPALTTCPPTSSQYIPLQNKISHAYATLIIHILHVLLAGKWDILPLLSSSNTYYTSPSFVATISHVVSATQSAESLLDLDPDAHFMPFFLGIYLFQGCLPLIVVADRLKTDAVDVVVKACDIMIRVHEAHIIRMPSEYQILFVSVLRLGLKEMQGRPFYVSGDPTMRYKQVFERYSWASEGRGLAG